MKEERDCINERKDRGVSSHVRDLARVLPTRFGPFLSPEGVRFRLWAPNSRSVRLELHGRENLLQMDRTVYGWHELICADAGPGSLYRFVLPDGLRVPDPGSRYQPNDVHGPSEVVDPDAYSWTSDGWRGRPWVEAVVYELHVGAFTPEGTFDAVRGALDHLSKLGVTALELMPVADFPGSRNWGYDGVLPYAPDSSYGRPEALKRLVDAVHAHGIMIFLDVVYNHFGPEGNYFAAYAPLFNERHDTPWGAGVNFDDIDGAPVREFFVENALYWLGEFRFDGLRIDAVHAIKDDSAKHVLDEIAERVQTEFPHRHVHLLLENEENLASRLARARDGRPLGYTAQWNDDLHHSLHALATGERVGYYADYQGVEKLARAMAEGFSFQGEFMPYRGRERGEPSGHLPPDAFISFIQNHDQVGNRATGDRVTNIASRKRTRVIAATYLLSPQIPMMFMGEEWSAPEPFPFFCDFGPELADAVRSGRREEFSRFPEFQDPAARAKIPDPLALSTFESAKLNWQNLVREPHSNWFDWYRRIIEVRRREIIPIASSLRASGYRLLGEANILVRWSSSDGADLLFAGNLGDTAIEVPEEGRLIWSEGLSQIRKQRKGETPTRQLSPWSITWFRR
jgi:malto-oligosyltrehalose trehalohydrolase